MTNADPEQLFVVSTISRETIAERLTNNGCPIESTDPRLTDEYCDEVAGKLYGVECVYATDAGSDAEDVLFIQLADKLNG